MAYSGPNSNRSHNDNKNDSISAPRHPSMSGHHLENYSSHHNKTDQLLSPNCPKPTQAVTTCMGYLFATSAFTPHLNTSTPIQTRVNHTTSLMQVSIRFLDPTHSSSSYGCSPRVENLVVIPRIHFEHLPSRI